MLAASSAQRTVTAALRLELPSQFLLDATCCRLLDGCHVRLPQDLVIKAKEERGGGLVGHGLKEEKEERLAIL